MLRHFTMIMFTTICHIGSIIIPILQMTKLRHRDVTYQDYTDRKWWGWALPQTK